MPNLPVLDSKGTAVGSVELKPEVFGGEVRGPLLHLAVTREAASRRAGTHQTKERSDVSGGGRKPWRQKGTGRARQGSIRAPQWRGGGAVFGPHPRDHSLGMPREARRAALRSALAAKVAAGAILVLDRFQLSQPKTKALVGQLHALNLEPLPTLLVVREKSEALTRAARNLAWLAVETPAHVSVYQLLRHPQVVFEQAALLALGEQLAR